MTQEKFSDIPSQQEIEKDIGNYLTKKYGERIKVVGIHAQTECDPSQLPSGNLPAGAAFNFKIKPEELYAFLNEYVIRQEDAKSVLATKICTHFNRIRYAKDHPIAQDFGVGQIKNNVLLIGPTGVGKTYLLKLIAKKLGVPFIKGDATKFSETGYVGGDVEDLVRDLVREADDNLERAQYGIIYIDEIDKIASSANRIGPDISRSGVQRALLKPMEETEVDLKVPHDPISQMEAIEQYRATGKRQRKIINTKNILFIMSGSFTGLSDIIKKRIQKQSIGFESTINFKKKPGLLLNQVMAEDLIDFGFESEFIGRLPVVTCLEELSADDLYSILLNFNCSVVVGKKLDFRSYGIHIQFAEEALKKIARKSYAEQTGARGLVSVLERILIPFERKLPSTAIRFLAVTPDLVEHPEEELARLLHEPERVAFHTEQFHLLARAERKRLVDFISQTKGAYLAAHPEIADAARLELIAQHCQKELMEITDGLRIFVDLIEQINKCTNSISIKCGLHVTFNDAAINWMLTHQPLTAEAIEKRCSSLLHAFEHGFGLLSQKKHITEVVIPVAGLEFPDTFINDLVAASFKNQSPSDSLPPQRENNQG
jgi:endopeptidase Clp ATP-binding regulatory subunit ClpX